MGRFFSIVLTSLVLITTQTARAQNKLFVYTPHGPEILKVAKQKFEQANPGVTVDWYYGGANEVYQRVMREGKNTKADLWWGGPQFMFMDAARKDLLTPYKPSWHDKVPAIFRDPDATWYGDMQTPLTIVYNSELLEKKHIPKAWDDLLKPLYKGKIILRYPPESGTMRSLWGALVDRQTQAGKSPEEALTWLERLEANVGAYAPHSQVMFMKIGQGLYPIGFWNAPEIGTRKEQGFPVRIAFPRDGMPVLLDCIAIIKKEKVNPITKKFYEFVTSQEFAMLLAAKPHNRIPIRKDLPSTAVPHYFSNPRFKVMPVDWQNVADNVDDWLQRWEDTIAKPAKKIK